MNKTIIIGNLVRAPETGTTPSGVNYCRFTVAVRKRFHKEGQPDSTFFRVTAWRGLGDSCGKYLDKGRKVAVVGEVDASAYTDRDGGPRATLEINADEVEFLTPRGQDSGAPAQAGFTQVDSAEAQAAFNDDDRSF